MPMSKLSYQVPCDPRKKLPTLSDPCPPKRIGDGEHTDDDNDNNNNNKSLCGNSLHPTVTTL